MRVPLFDIDWTLLKGGNVAHAEAFAYAFRGVYGVRAGIEEVEHHGMTDQQLILEVLKLHGIIPDVAAKWLPQAQGTMLAYFNDHHGDGDYVPLPGVVGTLRRLKERNIPCGLLTGNTEPIAWRKLELAGIRSFFTFGAFGDATARRVELIEIARQRCLAAHSNIRQCELVIVGDTPRDIECAQAGKIRSVAVASGTYTKEQLTQAGPDLVLDSLEESDTLLRFLKAAS